MTATAIRPNLVRAGIAGLWTVGGRLTGLAWTALLVATLGIGAYGQYAIGFAIAAMLAAPIDNIFLVRSVRVSDDRFLGERTTRAFLGSILVLVGGALVVLVLVKGPSTPVFLVGFALVAGGGEIAFNAYKSEYLRHGHPQVSQRLDLARQVLSILLGGGFALLVPSAGLEPVISFYLLPYIAVIVLALWRSRGHAPRLPDAAVGMLVLDALAIATYLQGDIVLLGLLAGSETAGYYSIGSVLALAATSLAQMFAQTYNPGLRASGGDLASGPGTRAVFGLSVVLGLGVAVCGLGALALGLPAQVWLTFLILGAFTALRCGTLVYMTVLYMQARDGQRVAGGWIAVAIKLALIAALASLGAPGAAIAAVLAEVFCWAWFRRAAHLPVVATGTAVTA